MKKSFKLINLGCANCAAKMENDASKLDGVKDVNISFMTAKMKLEADDDRFEEILDEIQEIIKKYESDCYIKR